MAGARSGLLIEMVDDTVSVLSRTGPDTPLPAGLRALCAEAARSCDGLVGPDTKRNATRIGVPVPRRHGGRSGALCVFGLEHRSGFSDTERDRLRDFAGLAGAILDRCEDLRRVTRKFVDVFQANPKPMWVYDSATLRFLDVNDAAVRFYGYSRDAFLALSVLDIRPPEERDRMISAVRDRTDLDDAAVWRHRKADGSSVDVITDGRAVTFDGREAVIVVALDRTEVQALRRDLGEAQRLLDTIIATLPIGVFVKDIEDHGRYIIYNPTLGQIVGRDSAAIVGRTDREMFPAQAETYAALDRAIAATGQPVVVEDETVVLPTGETRLVRTIKTPLLSPDGAPSRYVVGISEDTTERRRAETRMSYMALHDVLTGLPNRSAFKQELERCLATRPDQAVVTLLCLDLDHFKVINDTHGHQVGDRLLTQVAGRLTASLRGTDAVARLGGDEFAVVTMGARDDDETAALSERLIRSFDTAFDLGDCLAHVGCTIGTARATRADDTADVLMRQADTALYAAKAAGRGIVKDYCADMSVSRSVSAHDGRRPAGGHHASAIRAALPALI